MGLLTVLGRRRASGNVGPTFTGSGVILDWDAVNGVTTGTLVQEGSYSATTTPGGFAARRYETNLYTDNLRIKPNAHTAGVGLYVLIYGAMRNGGSYSNRFIFTHGTNTAGSGTYYARTFGALQMAKNVTSLATVATSVEAEAALGDKWVAQRWSFLPTSESPDLVAHADGVQVGSGANNAVEPPAIPAPGSTSEFFHFPGTMPMDLARIIVCTDFGNWDTYAPAVYGA